MQELGNVFLSGPMSGIENYNVEAFARAHALLKEAGARKVYDPAVAYLEYEGDPSNPDEWLRVCIGELTSFGLTLKDDRYVPCAQYDTLVLLHGWEDSHGALMERMVAEAIGMNVVNIEEVVDW